MLTLAQNIEFKNTNCDFQQQFSRDIKKIQNKKPIIPADKTTNFYRVDPAYTNNCSTPTSPNHTRKPQQTRQTKLLPHTNHTQIKHIIIQAKNALLFTNNEAWRKKAEDSAERRR